MKKTVLITGARGSGKSTALAGIVPALQEEWDKTLVFDTEESWSDLAIEDPKKKGAYRLNDVNLRIGEYIRAYDRFKLDKDLLSLIAQDKLPWVSDKQKSSLVEYYKYFLEIMDTKLATGKYKYVLIDTIEPVEAALTAWVESNQSLAGWKSKAMGGMETEGVRPLYENLIEGIGRRGVEYVALTSHLKNPWVNNRPVLSKVEPGGRLKLLSRISTLMVWLVDEPSNADGAPAGLVLKARIEKMEIENGRLKPRRVLPRRMPHFTWGDIEEYMKSPANLLEPKKGETISTAELEMVKEMLDDEQFKLMVLGTETELSNAVNLAGSFALPPLADGELSEPERLRLAKVNGAV